MRTEALVREVGFDRVNTAAYSPRPNTPAAEWDNQVADLVKQDRLNRWVWGGLVKQGRLNRWCSRGWGGIKQQHGVVVVGNHSTERGGGGLTTERHSAGQEGGPLVTGGGGPRIIGGGGRGNADRVGGGGSPAGAGGDTNRTEGVPSPWTPLPLLLACPRLNRVVNEVATERAQRFQGRTLEVLVEGPNPKNPRQAYGRIRHNRLAYFDGDGAQLKGTAVMVRVDNCNAYSLFGTIVDTGGEAAGGARAAAARVCVAGWGAAKGRMALV